MRYSAAQWYRGKEGQVNKDRNLPSPFLANNANATLGIHNQVRLMNKQIEKKEIWELRNNRDVNNTVFETFETIME